MFYFCLEMPKKCCIKLPPEKQQEKGDALKNSKRERCWVQFKINSINNNNKNTNCEKALKKCEAYH